MLRKKINKFLSVLVAVIIAFSCFILPCSAEEIPSVGAFQVDDFLFFIGANILDPDGNVVDTIIIEPDTFSYNVSGNSLYIDVSASRLNVLLQPGYLILFQINWSYPSSEPNKDIYFTFPESYSFLGYPELDGFYPEHCFVTDKSNCYVTVSFQNTMFSVTLLSNDNANYFPLVITIQDHSNDVLLLNAPTVFPGIFKFYSDMRSIMDFSLGGLGTLFSKVRTDPSLLVMILGFSIVGFSFALLRRFSKG